MTLKEFLKEKRALTKFRINYRTVRNKRMPKKEAEEYLAENTRSVNAIVAAFTWELTPEGNDYWLALDIAWTVICNKK